jgi:hypothetical protein
MKAAAVALDGLKRESLLTNRISRNENKSSPQGRGYPDAPLSYLMIAGRRMLVLNVYSIMSSIFDEWR